MHFISFVLTGGAILLSKAPAIRRASSDNSTPPLLQHSVTQSSSDGSVKRLRWQEKPGTLPRISIAPLWPRNRQPQWLGAVVPSPSCAGRKRNSRFSLLLISMLPARPTSHRLMSSAEVQIAPLANGPLWLLAGTTTGFPSFMTEPAAASVGSIYRRSVRNLRCFPSVDSSSVVRSARPDAKQVFLRPSRSI